MRLPVAMLICLLAAPAAHAACDGREIREGVQNAPVCVPTEPKRIVALDPFFTVGMLQELGVPVVGVPMPGIQDEGIRREAERTGAADLGSPMEPSLEAIVALRPDLIIGASSLTGALYGRLSQIAPTVQIETTDWKEIFSLLARVVGAERKAEQALQAYEARAAAIRARMPNIRLSVVRIAPGRFQVYLDGPGAYAPYAVLREAGVKRTAYETTDDLQMLKRPGWEELAALDGDVLFYVVASGMETAPDAALEAETLANPLWQMLPAVRAGRTFRVDRAAWMGFHGVASAHRVLDDIERHILAKP